LGGQEQPSLLQRALSSTEWNRP